MTKPAFQKFWSVRAVAPPALTLLFLGVAFADKVLFHLPPADATAYHARVREAAATLPYNIGAWLGTDTPVPPSAVALLRPNVILSRQYQDVRTGRTATLLVVQCEDARDLLGHYPPVCYVAHGWSMRGKVPRERQVDGRLIPVTDYTFTSTRIDRASELRIDNFMVLPDGQVCRDMDAVETVAQDYRRKFFGAAQIQIITDTQWSDDDRDDLFRQLIQAAGPLLREMRSGVTR
jgi:hypothetical protein